jgi:mannosyl-oligosaccharide glucosidase
VGTISGEYKRTGFLWENYDSETGKGAGCFPFTGWSALVVLAMGESYAHTE